MASQSNMTPGQAADLWPQLERTGLILGSPAPAVPTDGWLSRFMALVRRRHLRVDFIALHYYQDFTNPQAVAALRRQVHRQLLERSVLSFQFPVRRPGQAHPGRVGVPDRALTDPGTPLVSPRS
jgi:hypothetical protein